MKYRNLILVAALLCSLTVPYMNSQAQTCKEWYTHEDKNGNEVKDGCKVAWQENEIGQRNGRYIYYKEDGTPLEVANFKNDVLHGRYVLYSPISNQVLDSGRYLNGNKDGKWIHDGNCFVTYKDNLPIGKGIRKYKELQISGNFGSSGLYSGGILIHEQTKTDHDNLFTLPEVADWMFDALDPRLRGRYSFTIPFQRKSCKDCISSLPMELFKRIRDQFSIKDFVVIQANVTDGELKQPESWKVWINGKSLPNSYSVINKEMVAMSTEAEEKIKRAQLEEERKKRDESGVSILNASKFGIEPISFLPDSYEPDEAGKASITKLISYLNQVDANSIKQLILIGHAAADPELNRISFNPENEAPIRDNLGRQTIMSEFDLANLRMLLSLGREKSVYRAISEIKSVNDLRLGGKLWMLPAGTEFGNDLTRKNINQNVVQIVIITTDNNEINSLVDAIPFGTDFSSSPVLKRINNLILSAKSGVIDHLYPEQIDHP
jgi:hypothetical protein